MDNLVAVSLQCLDELGLPVWKIRHLRALAERVERGVATFHPGHASYAQFATILEGCQGEAPTAAAAAAAAAAAVDASKPEEPQPVPRDQWPWWANAVAKLATAADVGVGSTVKRLLGDAGDGYEAIAKMLGLPCKCPARRATWDKLYPYGA